MDGMDEVAMHIGRRVLDLGIGQKAIGQKIIAIGQSDYKWLYWTKLQMDEMVIG